MVVGDGSQMLGGFLRGFAGFPRVFAGYPDWPSKLERIFLTFFSQGISFFRRVSI